MYDLVFVKFNARLNNKHVLDRDPLTAYDEAEVTEWLENVKHTKAAQIDSDDEVFAREQLT